mgnify:CR=1 FL=1
MVDRDIIINRISFIEENLQQMTVLADLSEEEFLQHFY